MSGPKRPPHNHPADSICLILTCPRGAWDAARAAAPPVETLHCAGCEGFYEPDYLQREPCPGVEDTWAIGTVPPPSPVAGLREAVQAILDAHRDHERPVEPVPAPGCDPTAILIELQIALDAALHREDGAS